MATTLKQPSFESIKRLLIGPRLNTADAPHQTISKKIGLAVFASDALSSTAYATDEILIVLFAAGAAALILSLPVATAIIILLVIVTISYEQTIHAYPNGGGAYIVARDNLGEGPAQTAGAALLTDYILTVAVSISSGVAQITSAFPELYPYRVWIALGLILMMTLVNLRGVKESGNAFSIPTYFFLAMTGFTIAVGFYRYFTGTLAPVTGVEAMHHEEIQSLTLFLILKAFSSGCTALTGVEAISNGITAFREPRSKNAGATLIAMTTILAVIFFSITFLAGQAQALPSHTETIFSQLGRAILRQRQSVVSNPACRNHSDFDHGRQHRLRRLPPSGRPPRRRRLPAEATDLQGEPPCVFLWHSHPGLFCFAPRRRLWRSDHRPDPALCHWRFHVIHALADRYGRALVAVQ